MKFIGQQKKGCECNNKNSDPGLGYFSGSGGYALSRTSPRSQKLNVTDKVNFSSTGKIAAGLTVAALAGFLIFGRQN